MPANSPAFRLDINGLRAWAVVAVIGFHFGIAGFSGGFVGVDVFFVLSGYLMAGIVVSGAEKIDRTVSAAASFLAGFYLSRARRILPALICVCAALLMLGWFTLSTGEYAGLAKNIVSALAFLSNFRFSREAGYFDANAHEKALLHTWSLSVEWQFYLLFPILVLILMRIFRGRRALAIVLALLALVSLALSIMTSVTMPARAFFLLPWRAWELLGGALLWCLSSSLPRRASVRTGCEIAGFALIIGSIVLLNEGVIWPGWLAMVPVLGTVLILVAARQDSILTATPVAQWLGRSSYSLYLWHWPIVVALYYLELQSSVGAIVAGLTLTLLLGWLSYRFIETPARARLVRLPRRAEFAAILAALLVIVVPSQVVKMLGGVPGRFSPDVQAIFAEANNGNPRLMECQGNSKTPVGECTYGGPDLGIIVLGDSHAGAVVRAVEKALPSPSLHVLDWTLAGCTIIAGLQKVGGEIVSCGDFVQASLEKSKWLAAAPLMILSRTNTNTDPLEAARSGAAPSHFVAAPRASHDATFFDEIREGMVSTACEFARTRPVYYVRPIPEMPVNVPKSMARARIQGRDREVSISLSEYRARHAFVWAAQDLAAKRCGVKILDPLPYLCSDGRCVGSVDGLPIYGDDNHLNRRGADLLIPMFRKVFENEGRSSPSVGPSS